MYTVSTKIELPISHCLTGAYSGLCCGNVYQDGSKYELGTKILPVLHGHNYSVRIDLSTEELDKNGMVVDFKKLKEIIHSYFDKYDHSMILTLDNPLVKIYEDNYKENGVDFWKSRIFVWEESPTAEYMAKYWYYVMLDKFSKEGILVKKLEISVEETSNNCASFTEGELK